MPLGGLRQLPHFASRIVTPVRSTAMWANNGHCSSNTGRLAGQQTQRSYQTEYSTPLCLVPALYVSLEPNQRL